MDLKLLLTFVFISLYERRRTRSRSLIASTGARSEPRTVTSGRGLAAVTVWRLLAGGGGFIRWRRETFLLRGIFGDAQCHDTAEVAGLLLKPESGREATMKQAPFTADRESPKA